MKIGLMLAAVLLAGTLVPGNAHAYDGVGPRAEGTGRAASTFVRVLRVPRQVTEGDRVDVLLQIGTPRRARNVRIETQTTDIFGSPTWENVTARKVRQRRESLVVVPDQQNNQRYRAVVSYRGGQTARTAFRLKVWRWIPLYSFRYYSRTDGTDPYADTSQPINGTSFDAWYGYGSYASWESRHTLGRHCRRFSGVLGVIDSSPDGSSAQISLLADDALAFASGELTPGMDQRVNVAIPQAYRVAIQARNTALDGTPNVYPAIGDPRFLCTGL